jgi:hypothetical protein
MADLQLFTLVIQRLEKINGARFVEQEATNEIIRLLGLIEEKHKSMPPVPKKPQKEKKPS